MRTCLLSIVAQEWFSRRLAQPERLLGPLLLHVQLLPFPIVLMVVSKSKPMMDRAYTTAARDAASTAATAASASSSTEAMVESVQHRDLQMQQHSDIVSAGANMQ
jgi:hypothetical protein